MRSLPTIALGLVCAGMTAPAAGGVFEPDKQRCERILPTRTADQPERRDNTATADKPLLYSAVEHRIGGCSVLVMHKSGQIRRAPEIDETRNLFVPAR